MKSVVKSLCLSSFIAAAIQCITVGLLAPSLPRQVCQPGVERSRHFSFAATPEFSLENADGAIAIETSPRKTIEVTAEIKAYANDSDREVAAKYLDSLFKVEEHSEQIVLVTEPNFRPDEVELAVDYLIAVPEGTDLVISGPNGNVSIAKGCGRTHIRGTNRDIKIESPKGPVDIDITNGRVEVYDALNSTRLRTVNGKIYAHMRGGNIDAKTTNGNIVVTVLDGGVEACELHSMNGGITLVLPAECSAQVEAVTERGVVKSDFKVKPLLGHQRQRQIRGTIGSGKTRLSMDSLNGNIWLAKE